MLNDMHEWKIHLLTAQEALFVMILPSKKKGAQRSTIHHAISELPWTAPCIEEMQMRESLEESLRDILSYLTSETMKARKSGELDRAQRLSLAFKILSNEYDQIKNRKGKAAES